MNLFLHLSIVLAGNVHCSCGECPLILRGMSIVLAENVHCSCGECLLFLRRMSIVLAGNVHCSCGGMSIVLAGNVHCSCGECLLFLRGMSIVLAGNIHCFCGECSLFLRGMSMVLHRKSLFYALLSTDQSTYFVIHVFALEICSYGFKTKHGVKLKPTNEVYWNRSIFSSAVNVLLFKEKFRIQDNQFSIVDDYTV